MDSNECRRRGAIALACAALAARPSLCFPLALPARKQRRGWPAAFRILHSLFVPCRICTLCRVVAPVSGPAAAAAAWAPFVRLALPPRFLSLSGHHGVPDAATAPAAAVVSRGGVGAAVAVRRGAHGRLPGDGRARRLGAQLLAAAAAAASSLGGLRAGAGKAMHAVRARIAHAWRSTEDTATEGRDAARPRSVGLPGACKTGWSLGAAAAAAAHGVPAGHSRRARPAPRGDPTAHAHRASLRAPSRAQVLGGALTARPLAPPACPNCPAAVLTRASTDCRQRRSASAGEQPPAAGCKC